MNDKTHEIRELRASIDEAFARRFPGSRIHADAPRSPPGSLLVEVTVAGPFGPGSLAVLVQHGTDVEATRALCLAVGLRVDGSDPEREVEQLAGEVDRLREELSHARRFVEMQVQVFDDFVAEVWRAATGSTHEGQESVAVLLDVLRGMRAAR